MSEYRIFQDSIISNRIYAFLVVTFMAIVTGCVDTNDEIRDDPRNISNNKTTFIYNAIPDSVQAYISPEYSTAINTFAVKLTQAVHSENVNKNLVLSPFSVSRNLSAVTTVMGGTTSAGGGDSPDIVLDKPFVYFIRAGQNGLVLFSGVVNKP